jgi:signal transduction histidine kinase
VSDVDLFRPVRMPMLESLSARAVSPVAAVLLATAVAVSGTAAALAGYAAAQGNPFAAGAVPKPALPFRPGVETDGTRLTEVVPGGPGWTAGLRPGWAVEPGEADGLPGAIFACGGPTTCVIYHDLLPQSALAWRWWIETLAAILVIIGLVTWRQRPRLAGLLAIAAIAFSAPTYAWLGQVPLFPALYAASVVAPPLWLRLTGTHRLWTILLIGAAVVGAVWIIAWVALPDIYDVAEVARQLAIVVAVTAGIAVLSGRIVLVDVPIARDRIVDAAVVFAVIGWLAATWSFGSPSAPDLVAAVLAGVAVVAYFALRHRLRGLLARVTSAEFGQRATLQALEAERSRVARDLHDVPLQELTAIIHRLDSKPEVASETARLREIAGHLREVSVSLRPPVLDDVGLGAALAELADRHADDGGAPIRISLDDQTRIDPDSRPPADVELAVYRIVQEALTNAQRHARASGIVIGGVIGRERLRVTVADDGRGIDRQSVALAERAGRLGLASMRERAAAIGAVLTVSPATDGSGTLVGVEWSGR